ncbi:unnamed protein product [Rotaria sp. Silwood2]|nr:unnamed protein product [Rotaria sp. Silwood2]
MIKVDFTRAILQSVRFEETDLTEGVFYQAIFKDIHFGKAMLRGANCTLTYFDSTRTQHFDGLNLVETSFREVNSKRVVFADCNLMRTDMTKATFVGTIFYACTLAFATLVDIDLRLNTFHYSNLSYANMTGATLLYDQRKETLPLHNAIFPNRTFGTAKKPLMRFTVQRNASVPEQWHIHGRNIAVKPAEDKCVFAPALNNNSVISMKRNITVEKYYSNLISAECAVLNVQARIGLSTFVCIQEFGRLGNFLS